MLYIQQIVVLKKVFPEADEMKNRVLKIVQFYYHAEYKKKPISSNFDLTEGVNLKHFNSGTIYQKKNSQLRRSNLKLRWNLFRRKCV